MPRTLAVSDSIVIQAPPAAIYEQVSNPALMGRWSPENLGATVRDGARDAYVGMQFDGHNRRGALRWTTRCTVTAAIPGQRFAFRVHAIGRRRPVLRGRIATWEYRFDSIDGGTRVTETWRDDRRAWPDALTNAFDRLATRGQTFAEYQRGNIRRTLRNLKEAVESASTPS
ncbi:SRPBCC family protein [Streptomyces jumonjinensis]|uniref:SRPBCC family protein n=1 Tax=Streptomyces jumonjinensis TaxID=1945 RepID=UPI00379AF079